MEAAIDFKSLRAKFQEQSQLENRLVGLDKPKRFPPIVSHVYSLTNSSAEDKNFSIPPFNLRDDQKMLSIKRPSTAPSFPPHTNGVGSGVMRRSLKDRHLPLVLPASFSSSNNLPKQEVIASSKLVTSPIKCKKKTMPTPFKPAKFSKSIKEILEGTEHPESSRMHTVENGFSHHNGGSNPGSSCPSPEQPLPQSPTSEDLSDGGNVSSVLSTLERAKKKFSPKNLLSYTRPKSFYSSKGLMRSPPYPVEYENFQRNADSSSLRSGGYQPVISPSVNEWNLPQANGINHKSIPEPVFHLNGDMKPVQTGSCVPPLIKALPGVTTLGPPPMKPPRPPQVDLIAYRTNKLGASMNLAPNSGSVAAESVAAENTPVPPLPQFDAPHFLDFTSSVLEALNTHVNLAALKTEAAEMSAPLPEPEEAVDDYLHNDAIQKHDTGPAEVVDDDLHRAGLGHVADSQSITILEAQLQEAVTPEILRNYPQNVMTDSYITSELPSEPSISQREDYYETCDNIYEEVESISKYSFGQHSRKRKGAPKNPYAESPGKEDTRKSLWHVAQCSASARKERSSPDHHEEKEARKREKQRLEREKKEQKEKEKRENEMKKKFKITGQEEPMYHARVLLASKLRKHDLQVKSGDTVSIIRTTNCPKGKWLARDSQNMYGYISVMNVELNMKEMLELGKRASQAIGRGHGEADTLSLSSRSSYYNPVLTSSFTDDSEEWTGEDESLAHLHENMCPNRAVSMPDMFNAIASNHHAPSAGSVEDVSSHVNHEALQKLAVFFQSTRNDLQAEADSISINNSGPSLLCDVEEPPYIEEDQFSFTDVELLPPPELYADFF
ncbi:FYN-binding protein 2 [Silurus meridionalis]|uniref:FYN-binding protein 2 n=1 Tax=Silurus meridionalis TaxID=175797 RepID=UPI001EEAE0C9|nr:FYN-binding protein 2 [Silurus meridionalis]